MALYDYRPTRAGANAADFLGSFSGCIVCDGYDGYNKLGSGISRAGCWAHARRKFIEAEPTDPELKKSSAAAEGVKWCDRLFALERRCDGKDADGNQISPPISYEERHRYRQEESKPLVDAFFAWLETVSPQVVQRWQRRCSMLNEKKYLYTFLSPILALRSATTVPRMPSDHLWWDARTGSFPILQREQPPAQCCIL